MEGDELNFVGTMIHFF